MKSRPPSPQAAPGGSRAVPRPDKKCFRSASGSPPDMSETPPHVWEASWPNRLVWFVSMRRSDVLPCARPQMILFNFPFNSGLSFDRKSQNILFMFSHRGTNKRNIQNSHDISGSRMGVQDGVQHISVDIRCHCLSQSAHWWNLYVHRTFL